MKTPSIGKDFKHRKKKPPDRIFLERLAKQARMDKMEQNRKMDKEQENDNDDKQNMNNLNTLNLIEARTNAEVKLNQQIINQSTIEIANETQGKPQEKTTQKTPTEQMTQKEKPTTTKKLPPPDLREEMNTGDESSGEEMEEDGSKKFSYMNGQKYLEVGYATLPSSSKPREFEPSKDWKKEPLPNTGGIFMYNQK